MLYHHFAAFGSRTRGAHEAEVIASVAKIKLLKLEPPKFELLTCQE